MGVMVQGSVARGDHLPGSDLDLLVLLEDGANRSFHSQVVDGILVECHYGDFASVRSKIASRPELAYGLRDGRALHDTTGEFAELTRFATEVLDSYKTPERELSNIRYWLYTSRVKLAAALDANDEVRAGFLAGTTTWKALEGLWAVNDLPMPPGGAVLAYLGGLVVKPPGSEAMVGALIVGTARERALACRDLIDWFLQVAAV